MLEAERCLGLCVGRVGSGAGWLAGGGWEWEWFVID